MHVVYQKIFNYTVTSDSSSIDFTDGNGQRKRIILQNNKLSTNGAYI